MSGFMVEIRFSGVFVLELSGDKASMESATVWMGSGCHPPHRPLLCFRDDEWSLAGDVPTHRVSPNVDGRAEVLIDLAPDAKSLVSFGNLAPLPLGGDWAKWPLEPTLDDMIDLEEYGAEGVDVSNTNVKVDLGGGFLTCERLLPSDPPIADVLVYRTIASGTVDIDIAGEVVSLSPSGLGGGVVKLSLTSLPTARLEAVEAAHYPALASLLHGDVEFSALTDVTAGSRPCPNGYLWVEGEE